MCSGPPGLRGLGSSGENSPTAKLPFTALSPRLPLVKTRPRITLRAGLGQGLGTRAPERGWRGGTWRALPSSHKVPPPRAPEPSEVGARPGPHPRALEVVSRPGWGCRTLRRSPPWGPQEGVPAPEPLRRGPPARTPEPGGGTQSPGGCPGAPPGTRAVPIPRGWGWGSRRAPSSQECVSEALGGGPIPQEGFPARAPKPSGLAGRGGGWTRARGRGGAGRARRTGRRPRGPGRAERSGAGGAELGGRRRSGRGAAVPAQPWRTRPRGRAASRRSWAAPTASPSPRPWPPRPPSRGARAAPRSWSSRTSEVGAAAGSRAGRPQRGPHETPPALGGRPEIRTGL